MQSRYKFVATVLSGKQRALEVGCGDAFANRTVPALLSWRGENRVRNAVVEPGGSYYPKPAIPHKLRSTSPSQTPEVVTMRAGGSSYGDGRLELSSYPMEALYRIFGKAHRMVRPNQNRRLIRPVCLLAGWPGIGSVRVLVQRP